MKQIIYASLLYIKSHLVQYFKAWSIIMKAHKIFKAQHTLQYIDVKFAWHIVVTA